MTFTSSTHIHGTDQASLCTRLFHLRGLGWVGLGWVWLGWVGLGCLLFGRATLPPLETLEPVFMEAWRSGEASAGKWLRDK